MHVCLQPGTWSAACSQRRQWQRLAHWQRGSLSLEATHGPIQFNGEGGLDNRVSLLDYTDTTGNVGHIDQNTVGSFAGDNLFGAGGSLYFTSVARLDLNCGSGADTIYAQPSLSTSLFLNGNNPAEHSGDTLNLALAAAENYVVSGSPSNGNVTSSNLKTVTYTGFETGFIDDAAPYIMAQSYNDTGLPTIFVQFSEDVSNALSVYYLELMNTTANEQVPFAYLELAYEAGANTASFTFPGYAAGRLPPGEYTAKIYGSLADSLGNIMGVETPFSFTVVTPPPQLPGDYNETGVVDAAELVMSQGGLGTNVAYYGGADGSGNGLVDQDDYGVWRAHFGEMLPPPGAGNAVGSATASATFVAPVGESMVARLIGRVRW